MIPRGVSSIYLTTLWLKENLVLLQTNRMGINYDKLIFYTYIPQQFTSNFHQLPAIWKGLVSQAFQNRGSFMISNADFLKYKSGKFRPQRL